MKKFLSRFVLILCSFLAVACSTSQKQLPAIVPGVEIKMPVESKPQQPKEVKKYSQGIIGGVEPVYFLPMKSPFMARIDTGAETSSVDADNVVEFERDGEKWVSFDLVNRETQEKHHFEKKIVRQLAIKRALEREKRVAVVMDIRLGKEIIKAQFSLAERDKFNYQGLIGRNILSGRAIVDPSLENTLK